MFEQPSLVPASRLKRDNIFTIYNVSDLMFLPSEKDGPSAEELRSPSLRLICKSDKVKSFYKGFRLNPGRYKDASKIPKDVMAALHGELMGVEKTNWILTRMQCNVNGFNFELANPSVWRKKNRKTVDCQDIANYGHVTLVLDLDYGMHFSIDVQNRKDPDQGPWRSYEIRSSTREKELSYTEIQPGKITVTTVKPSEIGRQDRLFSVRTFTP